MNYNERDLREDKALEIAKDMMVAARTAPKAKGVDIVECATITGADKEALAAEMEVVAEEMGYKFFLRDAGNIRAAQAVVLIGTRPQLMGMNCGHCGFATCAEKPAAAPCPLNCIDVGIAIGSACRTAMDFCVDTRVMFSAGLAAQRMGLLGEDAIQVHAIPVSIGSKSPFFDRPSAK